MAIQLQTPQTRAAASHFSTAAALFLIALVAALLTRLPRLDMRPMHTDESVQAEIFLKEMLAGHAYTYNPQDGHGPLLTFSARWLCALTGTTTFADMSERLLRMTTVLYSLGLLLILPLMTDGLGRLATGMAALFTALSPMMVYYGRYFIMEVPLVFFTTLAIAAGWRYYVSRKRGWLWLAGAAVGFMHAAKETCIVPLTGAALALAGVHILEYFTAGAGISVIDRRRRSHSPYRVWHFLVAFGLAVLVSVTLYSDFFRDPMQPWESLKAYAGYSEKARGGDHGKPWWYYLRLLSARWEADGFLSGELFLLVLAAVGMAKALLAPPSRYENHRLQRFLALYAGAVFCGYSMITYKTPWTILGAEHALVILAGLGAATLVSVQFKKAVRVAIKVFLCLGTIHLGMQIWRQNFAAPADPERNPYVYAHTSPDLLRLVDAINKQASSLDEPSKLSIIIVHPEYGFPLPWYFRQYQRVGASNQLPTESTELEAADVIIMSDDAVALVGALMNATHRALKDLYELRPGVRLGVLFRRGLPAVKLAPGGGEKEFSTRPGPPGDRSLPAPETPLPPTPSQANPLPSQPTLNGPFPPGSEEPPPTQAIPASRRNGEPCGPAVNE
ncbi:MAG: flippase activity-associated protein Agl23 [Verrucomicrobiales bacterium]